MDERDFSEFDCTLVENAENIKPCRSSKPHKNHSLLTHSSCSPLQIFPKFQGESLKSSLMNLIRYEGSFPIEHSEILLYKLTKLFFVHLNSIRFSLDFLGKIHHLVCLQEKSYKLDQTGKKILKSKFKEIVSEDSYIFLKYNLIAKALKLIGNLAVKWKIFKYENYEFRYNGRALNVKPLNLVVLNSSVFSLDVVWMSFSIFEAPAVRVCSPSVLEMGKVLRDSLTETIFYLLKLNSYNPTYKIEKNIAYHSKKYRWFNKKVVPEKDINNFSHQRLNYTNDFWKKCFYVDPVLEELYQKIKDFELIFRNFEKELIKSFLSAQSYKITETKY